MLLVDVFSRRCIDGSLIPQALNMEDGLLYRVDRVLSVQKHTTGVYRYICLAGSRRITLLHHGESWWIER